VSTVAVSAAVALLAAAISTLAALYVGRRNREEGRHLAEFHNQLADAILRRQLCVTLGSRALLIGERAAEIRNAFASFEQLAPEDRKDEMRRRMDRLDLACDSFVESWVEAATWDLGIARLGLSVDELSNALEMVRLLALIRDTNPARQSLALRDVDRIARSIHRLCAEIADGLAIPVIT
jgi:hypothetical protein